jgi:hypothetical protein
MGLAFYMHYNKYGEDSERWKEVFASLLKRYITIGLLTWQQAKKVFEVDSSGNYYVDSSGIIIVTLDIDTQDDEGLHPLIPPPSDPPLDPAPQSYREIITFDNFVAGVNPPTLISPYSLADVTVVSLTQRVINQKMTIASNKLRTFINTNMYNY